MSKKVYTDGDKGVRLVVKTSDRTGDPASERAMKRDDIASAQRRTERAFRLAAVLDEMSLQPGRLTWKDKPKAERGPSKSKRSTHAPARPGWTCERE